MTAQGVGIGTTTPHASSMLEVNSTTKGFLPPRMTQTQMNAIVSPAEGLIVYCTNCSPKGLYNYDGSTWSSVKGADNTATVVADCNTNGFSGNYMAGFATSGTTFKVTITNNSFSSTTLAFQNSDLVLSGVSGLSVTATSPASATLAAGQSQDITYTISGTPAATGTLTGTWTKLTLNCSKTVNVTSVASALSSTYCTNASYNGTYVSGVALTSANTFTITLTNTSGSAISGMPAPSTSNLALTWGGSGTVSVASVSPTTSYNLAAGASQTITYTLSGTPSSSATLSGDWSYAGLTCTNTKSIGTGDATFTSATNNAFVFSVNDTTLPLNSQGTLAVNSTVNVPYTNGVGNYSAYASNFVSIPAQYCEDGASDWTFGYSYSAGTFSTSGNLVVTLITKKAGVITAWTAKRVSNITTINFNAVSLPLVVNGNTYSNTVGVDEGGDAIRGAIAQAGGASGAAYDAGVVNQLIPITLAEYNQILATVPASSKKGATT